MPTEWPHGPIESIRAMRGQAAAVGAAAEAAEADRLGLPSAIQAAHRAQLRAVVVKQLRVAGDALAQAAQSAADLQLDDHRQLEELTAAVDALRERHDG
jgi:predicted DNA-binding protein (UPF0278 family)